MIRLIQYWSVHWIDEYRNTKNVKFQTWLNERTGEKEYWILKPPNYKKRVVTKKAGNRYFHYLNKKYQLRVNKII